MPNFELEEKYEGIIAGVDEAGRGPWAGPVVAAAVILNRAFCPEGLDDSKKLSKQKREKLFNEIINVADFGIGIVGESVIDQINILEATKLAMKDAVMDLLRRPQIVLVDGNQKFDVQHMEIIPIVKGDSKSLSIAAASIIAKVTRDRIMEDLSNEFPEYSWEENAGYGTAKHIAAIERHGICKYHRKSFAPIKKYMSK
jgi:ribonuclease HII